MLNRLSRSALGFAVFALAFVVNPLYFTGCVSSEPEPNFGEAEMLTLLQTSIDSAPWAFTSGGVSYELSIALSQAMRLARVTPESKGLMQSAVACGNRTFYQSASACVTVTELPVVGSFTLNRVEGSVRVAVASNVNVTGSLIVYGENLVGGELRLSFGESDFIQVDNYGRENVFHLISLHAENLGEESLDIAFDAN